MWAPQAPRLLRRPNSTVRSDTLLSGLPLSGSLSNTHNSNHISYCQEVVEKE